MYVATKHSSNKDCYSKIRNLVQQCFERQANTQQLSHANIYILTAATLLLIKWHVQPIGSIKLYVTTEDQHQQLPNILVSRQLRMLIQIKVSSNILKSKQEITQFAAIKVSKTKRELIDAGHQVIKQQNMLHVVTSKRQVWALGILLWVHV